MADMDSLRREISEEVERIATSALEQTWRDTIDAAPEKTGALKALTDTTPVSMAGDFVATASIYCAAEYAEWTDAGSIPHQIFGHPWLAFYWERENVDVVFSTRDGHEPAYVNHPGTTGTRWFNGGVEDGEPMASRWERACADAAAA